MKPLVSIIIPSYNHSRYITEAVDSALSQSYENIEIIIIDDGSTDDTMQRLKGYEKHKNLHLLSQANKGTHATINRGMDLSRGKFISILNSDDVYHAGRIEKCLDHSRAVKADLVFSDLCVIDSESKPSGGAITDLYRKWNEDARSIEKENIFLQNNVAFTTSNFFMSAGAVKKIGYFRNLRYTHDWDWILRCAIDGSFSWLQDTLLYYRDHGANTIKEDNIWQHIVENSFITASYMTRFARKYSIPPDDLSVKVFSHLVKSTSFYPVSTMLFLWMLSGGFRTEEKLLRDIQDREFVRRFAEIGASSGFDFRTLLPPEYMNNYFQRERRDGPAVRIMKKISRLFQGPPR